MSQIREEVSFTNGRIIVRGKLVSRGTRKRADYLLYYKPNLPIAVIEAKDNKSRRRRRPAAGPRIRGHARHSLCLLVQPETASSFTTEQERATRSRPP